jgi:hypothetical protein
MAVHAYLRGGDIGKGRGLDGGMAVTAIETEAAYVMFMTERNGLLARNILHHFVGRADDHRPGPHHEANGGDRSEDRELGYRIRATRKELWHDGFVALGRLPTGRKVTVETTTFFEGCPTAACS